jgi:hypothetical protein
VIILKKIFNREVIIVGLLLVAFLAVRLPALHAPYHQDEYKWPLYAIAKVPGSVPHPPLSEFIYVHLGNLVGLDNFRAIPLLFSIASIVLLYIVVRRRFSKRAAQWTALIFTLSYYGILASLQVDTDGAILPFFFLLSIWCYDSFLASSERRRWLWGALLVFAMLLGIMVKISFILAIAAIALDYAWMMRQKLTVRNTLIAAGGVIIAAGGVVLLLLLSQRIFSGFSLERGIAYWDSFGSGFSGRDYFQTLIQTAKAMLYLSPLLIIVGIMSVIPRFRSQFRLLHIFITLSLIFYLLLFDFSKGALDRYFAFLIVPLCIFVGVLTTQIFQEIQPKIRIGVLWLGSLLLAGVFFLQFLPQAIPALYPKAEWIGRIVSLHWNFLFPFFGGSGPLGFYVSWNFIAMLWLLGFILFALFMYAKTFRYEVWVLLLLLGLVYNGVFAEEYLIGGINGSAPHLVRDSVAYITSHADVQKVIVYNDNGGYDVQRTGKYQRRLYAVPQYESGYADVFRTFRGHYLVIDIPSLAPDGFYARFLRQCPVVFTERDRAITATLYDCRKPVKIP